MKFYITRRGAIAFSHDIIMAAASFVLSLYLRLGEGWQSQSQAYFSTGLWLFIGICTAVFITMQLYRGLWRYASIEDLANIVRAVTLSILTFSFGMFFLSRLEGFPRSALAINWLVLLVLLGGPRFLYRAIKDRTWKLPKKTYGSRKAIPLMVIGATDQAELFLRELRMEREAPYQVVAILDDRPKRVGHSIHGVRIYPGIHNIASAVKKLARKGKRPQRIILAQEYSPAQIQEILKQADQLGLTLGRLPRMSEFKSGTKEGIEIRPIAIEDLLGRAQATYERSRMESFIQGKKILVTGAGGSIGGELCRQVAQCVPSSLILFEQNEYALYQIELELKEAGFEGVLTPILGDVRNAVQIDAVFKQYQPNIIFHAAAIKHVPLAEENPLEAIATNALGSRNVAEACKRYAAEAMVLISTDKAVRPANVMGATKRLAEMICQAAGSEAEGGNTSFMAVRFGNVLGSTGSVVPLFTRQIARGGPITVTHPDMVRYFMTIREAVELVIQAAALGVSAKEKKEHIFVLDMGAPIKIADLARQMIRLSGLTPEHDIAIKYTGLRPGEKLYEELFYEGENVTRTTQERIMQAALAPVNAQNIKKSLDLLAHHCNQRHASEAISLLKQLVPEFNTADKSAPINLAI